MNSIKQHRPAYFEGFENQVSQFDSVEDLLKIDWVDKFSKRPEFFRFSIAGDSLMAEYRGGREWWVIGTINNPKESGLPEWEGGIYCLINESGAPEDFPSSEVVSSCGFNVTLRDGRILKTSRG